MRNLVNKVIIFIASLAFYLLASESLYLVVPILVAMIISAGLSYFENDKITLAVYGSCLLICMLKVEYIPFIPLLCYDAAFMKTKEHSWLWPSSYLPLVVHYDSLPLTSVLFTAVFILVAVLLKNRTVMIGNLEQGYHELRDTTMEISLKLENQNKELMEKQDYEVHLATITERNRIARDIHDNVGHLLSRSILQVGALLAVNKDESKTESLTLIKDTLSEAMDSIRASVHDLHEDSVDMQNEIQKLIEHFTFCPVAFHYDVDENPDKNIKYCFIVVVKEALANIMRHSNARSASVTIVEHPAIFQLIIKDNGTKGSYDKDKGIGLKNITERVAALDGNMHIGTENGFRIFISIPKSKG